MVDLRSPIYERVRDSKRKQILSKRHRAALNKIESAFPSLLSDVSFDDETDQQTAPETYIPFLNLNEVPSEAQSSQNAARNHVLCQLVTHTDVMLAEEENLEIREKNMAHISDVYTQNPSLPGLATKLDRLKVELDAHYKKIKRMRHDLHDLINQDEALETGPGPSDSAVAYRAFFRQAVRQGLLKTIDALPENETSPSMTERHHSPLPQETPYQSEASQKRGDNLDFFSSSLQK